MKKVIFLMTNLMLLSCTKPEITVNTPNIETKTAKEEHEFEIVQLGNMRRDQYLLDKKTGRLWIKTCVFSRPRSTGADCDYGAWLQEDVQDLNGVTYEAIRNTSNSLQEKYEKRSK